MKILLTLAVIVLVIWLVRSARRFADKPDDAAAQPKPEQGGSAAAPLQMLQCAQCGVHLPGSDAVTGRKGSYCTTEHLQRAEG